METVATTSLDQELRESLDVAVLDEVADIDVSELRELANLYFAQAEEMLESLRAAVAAGRAEEVDGLAHKLAGSSAACGVAKMMQLLRTLEACGREKRMADARAALDAALEHLPLCRRLLTEYLRRKEEGR